MYTLPQMFENQNYSFSYPFITFIKARNLSKISVHLAKKLLLREFFRSKTIIRNQKVRLF